MGLGLGHCVLLGTMIFLRNKNVQKIEFDLFFLYHVAAVLVVSPDNVR